MDPEQFEIAMRPLEDRWPKAFPNSIKERIYTHVKDLKMLDFERVVRAMLDTQRSAPLPKDFLEAASGIRKRYFNATVDAANKKINKTDLSMRQILDLNGFEGCDNLLEAVNKKVKSGEVQ